MQRTAPFQCGLRNPLYKLKQRFKKEDRSLCTETWALYMHNFLFLQGIDRKSLHVYSCWCQTKLRWVIAVHVVATRRPENIFDVLYAPTTFMPIVQNYTLIAIRDVWFKAINMETRDWNLCFICQKNTPEPLREPASSVQLRSVPEKLEACYINLINNIMQIVHIVSLPSSL